MDKKPELIAFSQNKIGGVQNFYFNILSHDPYHSFNKKWIFIDQEAETEAKLPQLYNTGYEMLFPIRKNEMIYQYAKRLQQLISGRPGIVLTNFFEELATLHIHRRKRKTIFFICHDEWYLPVASEFEFLIDVFIAHNIEFYNRLKAIFPQRENDVYFIPYGVALPSFQRKQNARQPLKIVFLARLTESKGVYDLPLIQEMLSGNGINVQWTIIGDGPEKENLKSKMAGYKNAIFHTPASNEAVLRLLQQQDVYVLPSRLDGLPVSMLEAMSVGCVPIISEFNQGIKQMLPAHAGFILPIGDISAFAESIGHLDKNRNELEKRSIAARSLVEQKFNIENRAREYFDLFARYKKLKKRKRFKLLHYDGGFLNNPFVPAFVRFVIRKIRNTGISAKAGI